MNGPLSICVVDGCVKEVKSRGLCGNHYARFRRSGQLNQFPAQFTKTPVVILEDQYGHLERAKKCSKCNQIKPLYAFSKGGRHAGGVMANCKSCMSERWEEYYGDNREDILERTRERKRLYYKRNRKRLLEYVRVHYYSTDYYAKNRESFSRRTKKYRVENPLASRAVIQRRRTRKRLLPDIATLQDYIEISNAFNERCALTDSPNYEFDHFIPLSWGHGGTYRGNLIPLEVSINGRKFNKNPISFFRELIRNGELNQDRFDALIAYLSTANGLAPDEFIQFVFWCENHKRTTDQIQNDQGRSSLELWKEAHI